MIPLSTTTVTILRTPVEDSYDEPYSGNDTSSRVEAGKNIRAVIDRPSSDKERTAGGEQSTVDLWLVCDPCDLTYLDLIRDDTTGQTYRVTFVVNYGVHVEAGLRVTEGVV